MSTPWHLYLMAAFYAFSGIMHFVKPKFYLRIMPRFIPSHKLMVSFSGIAELLLAIGLLFKETRNISVYGIIAMLIIFFLVHFNMLKGPKEAAGVPKPLLCIRILLQFFFIYWAYIYLIP